MTVNSQFEVTLRRGTAPVREFTTQDSAAVLAALATGPLLLEVDAVLHRPNEPSDVSLGCMWTWLNSEGMAFVRLDKHCEHLARDPGRAGLEGVLGGFPD
ncbi:MAG TPA: hypothetical protein VN641_21540 [Urbifossiella sp.]|nr:hypothetical protein [Urbifossiella sp.]